MRALEVLAARERIVPYGRDAVSGAGPLWHWRAARHANRECDVFLSTNSYITPLFLRIPTAVIVYDLVAFESFGLAHRRARLNERLTLPGTVRRAARLLCISESTRADLERRFPAARGKTVVVPLGVSDVFKPGRDPGADSEVLAKYELGAPFVLSVGTREPRKNHGRLVAAFEGLDPELHDSHELVLVGARGWGKPAAEPDRVRSLGWVPDEDLAALYRACTVFCYPSLHEGFGLPVAEAMHSGAAVLAGGATSLRDVGGDGASYCDPLDVESIRAGLAELLRDSERRAELAERAAGRARELTWQRTAELVRAELLALVRD